MTQLIQEPESMNRSGIRTSMYDRIFLREEFTVTNLVHRAFRALQQQLPSAGNVPDSINTQLLIN